MFPYEATLCDFAGKCVVLKTSTRQTIFLPVIGLVDAKDLIPNDLVGVNKDSYLVLDKLPTEYDSRVKAMEVRTSMLHTCSSPHVVMCCHKGVQASQVPYVFIDQVCLFASRGCATLPKCLEAYRPFL
jgi:hypothetical protein